jgi:hypothetical protein
VRDLAPAARRRGCGELGHLLGTALSALRFLGVVHALLAVTALVRFDPQHRLSDEPDGSTAPEDGSGSSRGKRRQRGERA